MHSPRRGPRAPWRNPLLAGTIALTFSVACASHRGEQADSAASPNPPSSAPATSQATASDPFNGCDMCHVDAADEVVGTIHQDEGVGCVKCHGRSDEHVRDENNEVKPDRLFTRENIDKFCERCHDCERPLTSEPEPVCTTCHGPHTLVLSQK